MCTRTCLGVFLGIRFRHEKRCKTGAFRHPNALLLGIETRVNFFATNACTLPKYALKHVWECLSIRFRHEKRCKTGAFRHPNALLPGSETRVDFFAMNACNLPNYTLEHVWECF